MENREDQVSVTQEKEKFKMHVFNGIQYRQVLCVCQCANGTITGCCIEHYKYTCHACAPDHTDCDCYDFNQLVRDINGNKDLEKEQEQYLDNYMLESFDYAIKIHSLYIQLLKNTVDHMAFKNTCNEMDNIKVELSSKVYWFHSQILRSPSHCQYIPMLFEGMSSLKLRKYELFSRLKMLTYGASDQEELDTIQLVQTLKLAVYQACRDLKQIIHNIATLHISISLVCNKAEYVRRTAFGHEDFKRNELVIDDQLRCLEEDIEERRQYNIHSDKKWTDKEIESIISLPEYANAIDTTTQNKTIINIVNLNEKILRIMSNKCLNLDTREVVIKICFNKLKAFPNIDSLVAPKIKSLVIYCQREKNQNIVLCLDQLKKFYSGLKLGRVEFHNCMFSLEEDVGRMLQAFGGAKHIIFNSCCFTGCQLLNIDSESSTDTVDFRISYPKHWFKTTEELANLFKINIFPQSLKSIQVDSTCINRLE